MCHENQTFVWQEVENRVRKLKRCLFDVTTYSAFYKNAQRSANPTYTFEPLTVPPGVSTTPLGHPVALQWTIHHNVLCSSPQKTQQTARFLNLTALEASSKPLQVNFWTRQCHSRRRFRLIRPQWTATVFCSFWLTQMAAGNLKTTAARLRQSSIRNSRSFWKSPRELHWPLFLEWTTSLYYLLAMPLSHACGSYSMILILKFSPQYVESYHSFLSAPYCTTTAYF